jgi:hypothetical protein
MRTAMFENLELELEMAANLLSGGPGAEAESQPSIRWRYWDVWFGTGGGWARQYSLGPLQDTRANALRIRDELERQWRPSAQSQGATLLVRCFSWSPVSNQWLICQNYTG